MEESYAVSEGLPLNSGSATGITPPSKQKVTMVFELLRDPEYGHLFRVLENPRMKPRI
jgi:hypothetical protein